MIDIRKQYTTRDGPPVVLFTDRSTNPDYPIVGAIVEDEQHDIRTWTRNGKYKTSDCNGEFSRLDLVPVPVVQDFTLSNVFNIYGEGGRILATDGSVGPASPNYGQIRVKIKGKLTDGRLSAEAVCTVAQSLSAEKCGAE